MIKDIKCPYCEGEVNINHDDGYGYKEDVLHSQQCEHCDKYFTFTTSISFYYEPYKADCLNDGKHIWKRTHTYPKEYSRMQCKSCGEERNLTEEERKQL